MKIAAFDFATTTGWAVGDPGSVPLTGSRRFAPPGSTHEQISGAAIAWGLRFLQEHRPDIVVYEAPLPPSFMGGKTNISTSMILMGLPFLFGGLAYRLGIYRVHSVRVAEVRNFFLGSNMKSAEAERRTLQRCLDLGWNPNDHNAADAAAVWAYQCAHLSPESSYQLSPLFAGRAAM